ncbi:MAG: hypothetical protein K6F94_00570 [Bacteroidaceae bacterium]|nr:hypothetical protein [Bacteroidaceae bacterium]
MKRHIIYIVSFAILLLTACKPSAKRPEAYADTDEAVSIYPDYDGVTIPPNIAPLTFVVNDSVADAFIAEYSAAEGEGRGFVLSANSEGLMQPDSAAWRALLQSNCGKKISITVYSRRGGSWLRHRAITIEVAEEPIDPYLSYRLIEPGYELYRQLGLYQRDLTSYEETPIYENNRSYDEKENHCVNCHNYQSNDTRRMLFHVRSNHGGTIIVDNGHIRKIAVKNDSILGAGVYPSWHPTLPLVAFSTNITGQLFHMQHRERIEVLDEASDLLLYDAEANTVRNIFKTEKQFETFPCWSPSGDRLYYVAADIPDLPDTLQPRDRGLWMMEHYAELKYNIWSVHFDAVSRTFGDPQLEVDCASHGKSASVPRISPDGRFLLYTLADYGQFHIWHRTADLWMKPLSVKSEIAQAEIAKAAVAQSAVAKAEIAQAAVAKAEIAHSAVTKAAVAQSAVAQSEIAQATVAKAAVARAAVAHSAVADEAADAETRDIHTETGESDASRPLLAANSTEAESFHSWSGNSRWIVFASRRDDGNFTRLYIAYVDSEGEARKPFLLPQLDPRQNIMLLKSYNVPELTRRQIQVSTADIRKAVLTQEAENAAYTDK